jgi:hypothetical protein
MVSVQRALRTSTIRAFITARVPIVPRSGIPMPRDLPSLLYVGIKNSVVALDVSTGIEIWRAKLKGSDFVTVLFDGHSLVAANAGEVFALDPQTGAVLWHNNLKGLGLGIVSLASSRAPTNSTTHLTPGTEARRRVQASAGEG